MPFVETRDQARLNIEAPPVLPARPGHVAAGGWTRTEPYAWAMRANDPEVRAYLRESDRHARRVLRPAAGLTREIYAELNGLSPPVEGPPPFRFGRHIYQLRHPADRDYPALVRWPLKAPRNMETVIDANRLARSSRFFAMPRFELSPDERFVAYAVDTSGNRRYRIQVRELASGRDLADGLCNADCYFAWRADSRALVYTRLDPVNQRPFAVGLHELGRPARTDTTLYVEADDTFRCLLLATTSRQFIRIVCYSGDTEETKLLAADDPARQLPAIVPHTPGVVYDVDHGGGPFVIRTNLRRRNYAVFAVDAMDSRTDRWRRIGGTSRGAYVERMTVFRRHAVLAERRRGALRIRLVSLAGGPSRVLAFPDSVGEAWVEPVPGMTNRTARIGYTSLVTPVSYYDCALDTGRLRLVQQERIPGYDPRRYRTWRGWARARDNARIPFTALRRRGPAAACGQPAMVFAYGAYGTCMPPWFDQARLPLLDRGFVYVMAHVRGGAELGPAWHQSGRNMHKHRSATDVVDCARHLVASGLAAPGKVLLETLSAGGIAVGGAINSHPELFCGVLAHAPFVDPLTSMSDPDMPLTLSEYDEWGHPAREDERRNMCAYSPYDNVRRQRYPAMLVTANRNDSQVAPGEPVRWVARIRRANCGPSPILLLTHRYADHDGPSGRSKRLRQRALEWTFLICAAHG